MSKYVSVEDAMRLARQATRLDVTTDDITFLLRMDLLPNFGTRHTPTVLYEHATNLVGRVLHGFDLARTIVQLDAHFDLDFDRHILLLLRSNMGLVFDPERCPLYAARAMIPRMITLHTTFPHTTNQQTTIAAIDGTLAVWGRIAVLQEQLAVEWKAAIASDAKTTAAERSCIPAIYGNKARITSYLLSAIRQHLVEGSHVLDIMSGTGAVTRQLARDYEIHANDAAEFAGALTRSQFVTLDALRATELLEAIEAPYRRNKEWLTSVLGEELDSEDEYLHGPIDNARLEEYADFAAATTLFLLQPTSPRQPMSAPVDRRRKVIATMLEKNKGDINMRCCLATAYWSNCYFGLRQAVEIDSIRHAIACTSGTVEHPLLNALLLAAIDACASGPHYAQPPRLVAGGAIRKILERRARSVYDEFKVRVQLACRRRSVGRNPQSITVLPWRDALNRFVDETADVRERGVYLDPPYSRLQYSRFYHVFDTLLRYDYPECKGIGRTSEKERRFSSRFDSRKPSVRGEFEAFFKQAAANRLQVFVSYSTTGTIPFDELLELAGNTFQEVAVYACPIRHHSQGVKLTDRGRRLEVLIAAKGAR